MNANTLHRFLVVTVAAVLLLSGCKDDDNETPPLTGAFRVANGITDSDVNGLDAQLLEAFQFNGLDFGAGSDIKFPPEGSYTVQLDVNAVAFQVDSVPIDDDELTTVFTYGTVGGGTRAGFAAKQPLAAPPGGQFKVQVLHSAHAVSPTAPTLRFHFAPAGTGGTGGTTPLIAPFATDTTSTTLPAGNYEIVVTDGVTVLYDSGDSAGGVTLPPSGSNVLQIAALDAPGAPNGSPIFLLMLDNNNGSTTLLNDAN